MTTSLMANLVRVVETLLAQLDQLPLATRVATINALRETIHAHSPFKDEPVDCVLWVPAETVHANDYNPNGVAPAEMRLLRLSINADGYTQPIVTMAEGKTLVIIDGFHRSRVGRETAPIRRRLYGYLPVTLIREGRKARGDRMAATIRHNRARGLHAVKPLSAVVAELTTIGWSADRIARELGMEADEVLRLKQITGLAELFKDRSFNKAWE